MKKIKLFLVSLLVVLLVPVTVNAASGSVTVSGTSSSVVGNKVTLTVTLSSSTLIGSWQMRLDYDKAYLQLVSSTAEGGGTSMVNSSAGGVKSKTYTYVFKTLKSGTTNVAVSSYLAYAYSDLSEISLTSSSKNVKIMTQSELEASYSKDNDLKYLAVSGYEITPTFNKSTLEYTVTVPEDTKTITIKATANDSKSTVSGTGEKEVSAGSNEFEVNVKAENGSEKSYKITVLVEDSNPINVEVDGNNYTVVKIKEYLEAPEGYSDTTVNISGIQIPAFISEITKKTIVGLKNSTGSIEYFIYEDGNYSKYVQLNMDKVIFYPVATDKSIEGYIKGIVSVAGTSIEGFYKSSDSRFTVIYGINIINGEEGFYTYDKDSNTIVKFDEDIIDTMNEYQQKINLYTYIIFGFSGILIIMFILLLNKENKKKRKHIDINIPEEIKDENEIEEIENTLEEINYEEKKNNKKKNKKHKN